jgi:hypothetical protein
MIINPSTLTNGVLVIPDDDVNIPGPALKFSGTTDAVAVAGKLVDTTRPIQVNPSIGGFVQTLQTGSNQNQVAFGGQGVQVGDIVYNTSTNVIAVVGAIDSSSILSLVLPDGSGIVSTAFDAAGTQAYAIYQANGSAFNNGLSFGFRATVGAILDVVTPNPTAGYTGVGQIPLAPDGGTILDLDLLGTTFTLTQVAGAIATCTVLAAGKFSANSLVGRTVLFSQARLNPSFGGGGTGAVTFTFAAADENLTDRIQASGKPKAFQIYNGHTTVAAFNVLTAGGDTVLLSQVPAGSVLPLAVVRVWSAGTTAAALGSTIAFT